MGRNHSGKNAIESIEKSFKVGFKNINIDIIYNTAVDSRKLLEKDTNIALNLPINHISAYSLTIEDNTIFGDRGEKSFENLEDTEWLFNKISQKFEQYEISNFGNESKHNLGYWQGDNYLGIGSGAVGFWENHRIYPHRDVAKYIANPIDFQIEKLSENDLRFEKLFLGFRSKVGVLKNILSDNEIKIANMLVQENILKFIENRYINKNYLIADELALRIFKEK